LVTLLLSNTDRVGSVNAIHATRARFARSLCMLYFDTIYVHICAYSATASLIAPGSYAYVCALAMLFDSARTVCVAAVIARQQLAGSLHDSQGKGKPFGKNDKKDRGVG